MDPELLARIAELLGLSADEVQQLTLEDIEERLVAAFDAAATPEEGDPDLEVLTSITEATEGVRTAIVEADEAAAARAAEIEELRTRVRSPTAETEPEEVEPEPGAEEQSEEVAPGDAPEPEAEPEAVETETPVAVAAEAEVVPLEPETAPAVEPIAAAVVPPPAPARTPVRMARRPAANRPVVTPPTEAGEMVTITAAADVPNFSAGARINSFRELGKAFVDRIDGLIGADGARGKVPVARMHLNYPAERQLLPDQDAENFRKVEAVTAPRAIAAAGGLCAPVAIRYEFENVSVDDRPVRDSLARFNADRGGINVPTSPLITAPDAGVDVITEAEDTSSATKPCVTVTCPSYTEVDISAIYQCVQIGNFSRRTFPELFAEWWALAGALHARKAEGALLDGIASVTVNVTDGQNLGAARDFLEVGIRARAQAISRHRMARTAMFEWLIPEWMLGLIKADLVREHAGEGGHGNFSITDAQIEGWLRNAGINPVWYKDTETGEGMIYGAQGVQALLGWNLNPVTYFYPTGSFLFLDGGTLDLGTEIRDTTMNEQNNVRAFTETFENVAFVGQVIPLEITHSLCVSGAGSLDIAVSCPENS